MGVKHLNKSGDVLGYATDVTVQKLYELTNQERSKYNLNTLNYNDKLAEAAQKKAENMFAEDYWAHYGPKGETPWDFILGAGYQYEYAGENLAKNFLFSNDIVDAWMASPTHKENMVRKEYTDVGFAVVNGILNGEETTLVVQMFGAPLYAKDQTLQQQSEKTVPVKQEVVNPQPAEKVNLPAGKRETKGLTESLPARASNAFHLYFNLNIVFFLILVSALLLDFYFATKMKLTRLRGKNLIHMMFISFIIIGAYIIIKGSIS